MFIQPVVEDIVQEQIIRTLFFKYRPDVFLYPAMGRKGNGYIRQKIRGFNEASKFLPYIILTDLDNAPCPPELINDWINFPLAHNLMFRIAVKEAEAWLLADRIGFAKFIGVAVNNIPLNSETILSPKEFIVKLAKKSSKRKVKQDIIPEGTSVVGPGYNPRMEEFIINDWNTETAMNNSQSLTKAINRIRQFHPK